MGSKSTKPLLTCLTVILILFGLILVVISTLYGQSQKMHCKVMGYKFEKVNCRFTNTCISATLLANCTFATNSLDSLIKNVDIFLGVGKNIDYEKKVKQRFPIYSQLIAYKTREGVYLYSFSNDLPSLIVGIILLVSGIGCTIGLAIMTVRDYEKRNYFLIN